MSQWCPPGQTMCCICFRCTPNDELYVDPDGQKWDVCAVGEQCAYQAGLIGGPDQGQGLRALIAKLERLDDRGRPVERPPLKWSNYPPVTSDYCECWICNPLVKAREKVGKVCPTTGLGFIGPMPAE